MGGHSIASLVLAIASLAVAGAARAESDPLKAAGVARIRDSFKVDGIALFDAHAQHAARMGICAQSIFAGLKWCVSGTIEEKSGEASYVKTTGYNINADNRIVYAISSRRSYPLRREEFDGVVQAIGARYGAGAGVLAFRKAADESGGVDSLIAVWGGLRLVQLSEAEYALVESGGSLKRGHLVDHRFNLVVSAKQRDPIYKIEGEAGYILHLMATSPDRADVIARTVYPPPFLPPPAKPGTEPGHPLVGETVRRSTLANAGERPAAPADGAASAEDAARSADAKRIEAERGLAAERLLREEAERRAAEEKAARAEAERKAAAERRAFEEEKKRLEDALKAARDRADREGSAPDERRRAEAAERKAAAERREAEERARQLEEQRKALEERRRKDEAERKAAEERARRAEAERAEAERKVLEERRRKDEAERKAAEERTKRVEAERAEAERKAAEERRRKEEAERADRAKRDRPMAEERRPEERIGAEQKRAQEESERAAEQSRQRADEQGATERKAEAERLARERAQRPESWRQRAAAAAKDAGAIWSFGETVDRVADERTLRSQTVFASQQPQGDKRLAIEVTFECMISGRDRRLVANARGFDRNSGVRVAFRSDGEGTFGVRTRFMLDDNVPQGGLLFREREEDTASILELPMASAGFSANAPRGAIWLRHHMVMVEFPLVSGTVTATIAPQAENLRRVLEACAQ